MQPASRLIESKALNEREAGQAELILGIAYNQQGKWELAQSACEKALHLLSQRQEYAADHAATLDNFAQLYLEIGYPDIAMRMDGYVLKAYEGLGDHTNVARSCITLAGLEINEGHHRKGREYLQRMLLGKSYAQAGQSAVAMEEMRKGLRILEQSTGTNNVKYLAAEIAYSEVLDRSGAHTEAARLKDSAEQGLAKLNRDACPRCSISVVTLR